METTGLNQSQDGEWQDPLLIGHVHILLYVSIESSSLSHAEIVTNALTMSHLPSRLSEPWVASGWVDS